jgi:ribosomal-protein-alanine N-acetyltransferase
MTHLGTVRLETDRLILRRFVKSDVKDVFNNWSIDPEVTKFLSWQPHRRLSQARVLIKNRLRGYARKDYYSWAMELKATGQVIGNISVGGHNDATHSVNIGYVMGRAWWNQGYMTEALRGIIKFFFEQCGMNRIEATHDTRNPGSGRVMQKAGMTCEGTLRQAGWSNLGLGDRVCYAILASEYNK